MHNYHSTYDRFPAGFNSLAPTTDAEGTGPGWGWAAMLLPYLEQDNLYRQIDFKVDIAHPRHDQVRITRLPIFLCPSDDAQPTFDIYGDAGLVKLAFGNYVGVGGTYEVSGFPDSNNGPLLRNWQYHALHIRDGTSNTMMVGERASRQSPMTTWVGSLTGATVPPLNPAYEDEGPPVLVLTNTGEAADRRTPNNALGHVEDINSRHTGGVNILFCDGSVRFIRDAISPMTWEALGTRDGGEPIGDY